MKILAIQEAHDASVALMIDGEIVAALQEERFSGLKGDYGYPERSINYCLKFANISAEELDAVLLCSHNWNPVLTKIKRNANFKVSDWVKEQYEYWKPVLFEKKKVRYYDLYKDRKDFQYDETYEMDDLLDGYMDKQEMEKMGDLRKKKVATKLGISRDKIKTVTHEFGHYFYAYYGSFMRGRVLSLTAEGIGDYSNGTVNIFEEGKREELSSTKENHLGHIYQYITLLLGMKPAQHEYKVMGLAPYSNEKELEKSYKVFKDTLKVDGLNIVYGNNKPDDLYFWFRDRLEGHRFDGIAGGVQKFLEDILSEWFAKCTKETGLTRVVFSGGVAQNIKACKSISELDTIDDIYVPPAAGDASLPLGACYYEMSEHIKKTKGSFDVIKPLDNIYLGPEFTNEEVYASIKKHKIEEKYTVKKNATAKEIASLLSEGKIIARCAGRMEFGLRALGNRSIMADPRDAETVRKINSAIKFRDFWMPFTPTILAEREKDYIVNPKGLISPFMAMAFESTPLARKELIASLHPADLTTRPQILERRRNPKYYDIIKEFENITGVGGILNTSFNLHGLPIVLGPDEAIYTLENSELDGVIIEDYLILRG